MSQEKIDRYKEEKANRKKTIAKQKRNSLIAKIAGAVVIVGLLVWVGVSGYRTYQAEKEAESAQAELQSMLEEYYATSSSNATSSSGVNLEQNPSNVTTGDETKEGETKEDETTSKQDETKAEEETSAE